MLSTTVPNSVQAEKYASLRELLKVSDWFSWMLWWIQWYLNNMGQVRAKENFSGGTGGWAQGFAFAKQAFYYLSHTTNPERHFLNMILSTEFKFILDITTKW
jgi:hypothetical protein